MRPTGGKKLSLSKETLRGLSTTDLQRAGGMRQALSFTGTCDTCGNCVPSPGSQTGCASHCASCVTICVCSAVCE